MELKEITELSSRTLTKHLDKMLSVKIIEKKTDVESGKYPIPVLYKAEPELVTYTKATISRQEIANQLEGALNETKDPLVLLDAIHESSQANFLILLTEIQEHKIVTNEEVNFYAECFLWPDYKLYTSRLIEASRKIINDFNITQLLINQAKRYIRVYGMTLKIYERALREQENIHDVPRKLDT